MTVVKIKTKIATVVKSKKLETRRKDKTMNIAENWKIILKVSISFACLIIGFWTAWHCFIGYVPLVKEIKVFEHFFLQFSFPISRWWDCLIGLIWIAPTLWFSDKKDVKTDAHLSAFLSIGSICGLIFGIFFGVILVFDLGFLLGLITVLVFNFFAGIFGGWKLAVVVAFNIGMGVALMAGLPIGLFYILPLSAIAVVGAGSEMLFQKIFFILRKETK